MSPARYVCPECRCCYLQYHIKHDDYYCFGCDVAFSVLSTEQDHVAYDGGPPKRQDRETFHVEHP